MHIIDKNISTQTKALYRGKKGGNGWRDVPKNRSSLQKLTDAQILELSALVVKIEKHYGAPQDIEWALADGKFYITQSRPITTLKNPIIEFQDTQKVEDEPRYFLHFTLDDTGAWISEAALSKRAFGAADYVYLIENGELRAYLSQKGLREARHVGDDIRNPKKYAEIVKQSQSVLKKLSNYKKLNLTPRNAAQHWDQFVAMWEDIWNVYRYSDEPFTSGIAESLREELGEVALREALAGKKHARTMGKSVRQLIKAMQTLGRLRLRLHRKSADMLIKNGEKPILSYLDRISGGLTFNDFSYMTVGEVHAALKTGSIPWEKIKIRQHGMVVYRTRGKFIIGTGAVFKRWKKLIHAAMPREIRGSVAHPGVVTGRVVRHLSWTGIKKLPKGSILVTGMTNPQMIPYLKRAGAIVTDEGGIVCHAAIIAREMKIPCIVGTQVATERLKDGDLVHVDAERGVVTIATRNQRRHA